MPGFLVRLCRGRSSLLRLLPGLLLLLIAPLPAAAAHGGTPDGAAGGGILRAVPHEPGLSIESETTWPDTLDIVDSVSTTTLTLTRDGVSLKVPYYANRPFDGSYDDITRAVVVLHGTLRNAWDYYDSVMEAARMAGQDQSTLVIAPQFLIEEDVQHFHLPGEYLFWSYMGWRQGDHSLMTTEHPRPWRISSFAVVDTILLRLAAQNPNLRTIVVAGHSAGGQFTARFAAGSRMESYLASTYGVAMRTIVSNPSSYLYLDAERWIPGTSYTFAVPPETTIARCPAYDEYKYGLNNPNEYMSIGSDVIRQQYAERTVIYLLGGDDTDPNGAYLETNCEAELEGSQRLERGTVYWQYLQHFYGPGIEDRHLLAVVPHVAHDGHAMLTSECGVYYLFDFGSCAPPPASQWTDVTTDVLAAPNGEAVAWGDYDHDGNTDLFVPSTDSSDRLIRNDGAGVFSDATPAVLEDPSQGMSAAWGDYDGDGDLDLYVANWRASGRLYRNDGDGRFTDVTAGPLGVSGDVCDVSWVDYDNDGRCDLFVTRTNDQTNDLLHNDGGGTFSDATPGLLAHRGNNRDAAWGDYDGDGDQDLYLAVDGAANKLFRNDGGGVFTDVTTAPLDVNGSSSSAAWGDYDNDGDLDLYLARRNQSNKLFRNDGDGVFTDVTTPPLNDPGNSRSAAWGDYDHDGCLDLFIVNTGGSNVLLHNRGNGFFEDASQSPLDIPANGYCAAWCDFDNDGDLDLYVANRNQPNKLFRNDSDPPRHWFQCDLSGVLSNSCGLGARVLVSAGGRRQMREIGCGSGYLAQNALTADFGLGSSTRIDTLEVRWPSGCRQFVYALAADQRLRVVEQDPQSGVAAPPFSPADAGWDGAPGLLGCYPSPAGLAAAGRVRIVYTAHASSAVDLRIFDGQGRQVRVLRSGATRRTGTAGEGAGEAGGSAARHEVDWNGRDDHGRSVPPGVYFCRWSAEGRREVRRIVVAR